mgnify:CR=1 FL=1
MEDKNIERLIKGSEQSYLIATKNGTGVVGTMPAVLSQFSLLVRNLRESISDKKIKEAFELGFKTDKELEKIKVEKCEKLLKKLLEKLGD